MAKCIYCLQDKPGSKAHVIPEALGGTLSFEDVCQSCNSQQGDSFEGKTINSVLFSLARYALDIAGKQRQAPNPLARQYESNNGLKVRLDKDLVPHVIPTLTVTPGDNGQVIVQGTYDASDRQRLEDDVAKVLVRQGLEQTEEAAKRRAQELLGQQAVSAAADNSALKTSFAIDMASLRLLYLKIAYEIAYLELGPKYLSDRVANTIRSAINERDKEPKVRGQLPVSDPTAGVLLADRTHHYVMLMNNAAIVSLFGFAGSFEYCEAREFVLTDERAVIFDFDPVAKTYRKLALAEYLFARLNGPRA